MELSPEDQRIVRTLGLITAKKVLYVANVDEADLHGQGPLVQPVRERAAAEDVGDAGQQVAPEGDLLAERGDDPGGSQVDQQEPQVARQVGEGADVPAVAAEMVDHRDEQDDGEDGAQRDRDQRVGRLVAHGDEVSGT